MSNLIKVKQILGSATNGQVLTTVGNKSVWSDNVDIHASGLTYDQGTYDLTLDMNDGNSFTASLASLTNDVNVTGGTYDMGTGVVTFTNNSGGTFEVSGFTSGMTDTYTTTATTSGNVINFSKNIGTGYNVDLTTMLSPYVTQNSFSTSGSYDSNNNEIVINGNSGFSSYTIDLSGLSASLSGDTWVTGGTMAYAGANATSGSLTLMKNNGSTEGPITGFRDTHVISGILDNPNKVLRFTNNASVDFDVDISALDINDTYVTGGTYNNSSGLITFSYNDATPNFTVDLGDLDLNDTHIISGVIANGSLTLELNNGSNINVSGNVIQSVVGSAPITASTTNGVTTVGIDPTALPKPVGTLLNKNMTPDATTGTGADTGLSILADPIGYIKVEVNGVGVIVATTPVEMTTADCYFGTSPSAAIAMGDVVSGNNLYWNNNSSYDLEDTDRVDFFYDVLQ